MQRIGAQIPGPVHDHVHRSGDWHSWSPVVSAEQAPPSGCLGLHACTLVSHHEVDTQSPSPLHIALHALDDAQVAYGAQLPPPFIWQDLFTHA